MLSVISDKPAISSKATAIQRQKALFDQKLKMQRAIATTLVKGTTVQYRDVETGEVLECSLFEKDRQGNLTFADKKGRPIMQRSLSAFASDLHLGNARIKLPKAEIRKSRKEPAPCE